MYGMRAEMYFCRSAESGLSPGIGTKEAPFRTDATPVLVRPKLNEI